MAALPGCKVSETAPHNGINTTRAMLKHNAELVRWLHTIPNDCPPLPRQGKMEIFSDPYMGSPNLVDAWRNPITYSITASGDAIDVISAGQDKRIGTADDITEQIPLEAKCLSGPPVEARGQSDASPDRVDY